MSIILELDRIVLVCGPRLYDFPSTRLSITRIIEHTFTCKSFTLFQIIVDNYSLMYRICTTQRSFGLFLASVMYLCFLAGFK